MNAPKAYAPRVPAMRACLQCDCLGYLSEGSGAPEPLGCSGRSPAPLRTRTIAAAPAAVAPYIRLKSPRASAAAHAKDSYSNGCWKDPLPPEPTISGKGPVASTCPHSLPRR